MRNILLLINKEFKQIFRNRAMLAIIVLLPIIQLLVLSNAADFEIKKIYLGWEDYDKSALSAELLNSFVSGGLFELSGYSENSVANDIMLRDNRADVIISIPKGFERDLVNRIPVLVQLRINAIDGAAAGLTSVYTAKVLSSFYLSELLKVQEGTVTTATRYLYNAELNYKTFMIPGILVILVSIIGLLLTALNIAREKEIGTIEQINVTPIKKHQFILGKLIPMLIIGICEFWLGVCIARFVFGVPFVGSPLVQMLFLIVYLFVMLGIGLIISTQAQTQQQAMFVAFFLIMVFVFLSGLFTPV
ncbi:MAG: ABC transporter permease, partial [Candidatus Cloacimonetes bacterium]|nr:ABC transporter permease [Candidatus Cloacimonadota bacterium]